MAVCFLWHCPAGRPGLPLTTTLPCGARTFLGGTHEAHRRDRPTDSSVAPAMLRARWTCSHIVLLLAAGLAAGTVNALAGGGSLITFPTLIALGLPPVPANVTNSVAVSPGYVASVVGSRARTGRPRASPGPTVPASPWCRPRSSVRPSAACCCWPPRRGRSSSWCRSWCSAPTAVLAFRERLRAVVGHPRAMAPGGSRLGLHLTVGLGAVYGGYFGAALGVMLVAALGLVLDEDLAHITALKNAVSAVVGLGTVVAFAVFGPVDWVARGRAGARHHGRRLPGCPAGPAPAGPAAGAVIVTAGLVVGVVLLVRAF